MPRPREPLVAPYFRRLLPQLSLEGSVDGLQARVGDLQVLYFTLPPRVSDKLLRGVILWCLNRAIEGLWLIILGLSKVLGSLKQGREASCNGAAR